MKTLPALDTFTLSYLAACLWSSNDESTPAGGEPFDQNYSVDDFAPEAIERAVADCTRFQAEQEADLIAANIQGNGDTPDRAGFLFWLNRCGHGSGFWDEKSSNAPQVEQDACDRLSDACKAFGNLDPYLGDDGQIYFA